LVEAKDFTGPKSCLFLRVHGQRALFVGEAIQLLRLRILHRIPLLNRLREPNEPFLRIRTLKVKRPLRDYREVLYFSYGLSLVWIIWLTWASANRLEILEVFPARFLRVPSDTRLLFDLHTAHPVCGLVLATFFFDEHLLIRARDRVVGLLLLVAAFHLTNRASIDRLEIQRFCNYS